MKVLMLCIRSPYPPADGGSIAMYNGAMGLSEAGAEVKILSFNTKKHFVNRGMIPGWFIEKFHPEFVYLDATVRPLPALLNIFSNDSYNISRFNILPFHQAIEKLLRAENFDVIQLESLFMTPYLETIRNHSKAPIVLRAHNVEYIIWKRLAAAASNPLKKWYLSFLSDRLQEYETGHLNQFDGLVTLTPEDEITFQRSGCSIPTYVSPIGIDTEQYRYDENVNDHHSIAHLGAMDWLPNIEAIDWFLEHIYPRLQNSGMNFTVHLAGKGMPERIFAKSDAHLKIYGRIEQINDFFADKQIMIVPLLSGGGMRVKIIEGMAMGKTIIATTVGAEGIRCTNEENILIADTPEAFASAILRCVADPVFCKKLGSAARRLAMQEYENKIIGKRLLDFYHSKILNRKRDHSVLSRNL